MTEATYTEVVWWQPESWDIYISEKGNDTEITRFILLWLHLFLCVSEKNRTILLNPEKNR